jgi:hypothetical protein
MLLAMLFIADRYLPNSSSQIFMREARVDKSIIRIQSAHKWPERIVFNTNLPTIVPSPLPVLADVPVVKQPREALAQLIESSRQVPKYSEPARAKRKVAARARPARMAAYRAIPEAQPTAWSTGW